MKISSTDFKPGDFVRFCDYGHADLAYRRRLLALGLTRGLVVQIIKIAPLGCPVLLVVRGSLLSLRKMEADSLEWERP